MDVELYLSPREIKAIFAKVPNTDKESQWAGEAHALDFSVIKQRGDSLWMNIRQAIDDVAENGSEKIGEWLQFIKNKVTAVRQELGARAEEVLSYVQGRLLEACQELQAALLKLLPSAVTVHQKSAGLQEVGVQYQLAVGTTLVASVNWALQMTAGSTLSVSAKYAL